MEQGPFFLRCTELHVWHVQNIQFECTEFNLNVQSSIWCDRVRASNLNVQSSIWCTEFNLNVQSSIWCTEFNLMYRVQFANVPQFNLNVQKWGNLNVQSSFSGNVNKSIFGQALENSILIVQENSAPQMMYWVQCTPTNRTGLNVWLFLWSNMLKYSIVWYILWWVKLGDNQCKWNSRWAFFLIVCWCWCTAFNLTHVQASSIWCTMSSIWCTRVQFEGYSGGKLNGNTSSSWMYRVSSLNVQSSSWMYRVQFDVQMFKLNVQSSIWCTEYQFECTWVQVECTEFNLNVHEFNLNVLVVLI